MSAALRFGLPLAGRALCTPLFDALLPAAPYRPLLQCHAGADLTLALAGGGAQLSTAGSIAEPLEITPGLTLDAAAENMLLDFLHTRPPRINHIGVNLAAATVTPAAWRALIDTAAAALPCYRLEIGSANEVVMVLNGDTVQELVYDRSGAPSSLHICLAVDADRAELEAYFPSPCGGYKAGDEAFFYSVGLPLGPALACYADFIFSDAPAFDWQAIAAAAGQRLG